MKLKTRTKFIAVGASSAVVAGLLFAAASPASASQELAWTTVKVCVSPNDPAGTQVKAQFSGDDNFGNWVVTPEMSATTTVAGDCFLKDQFRWKVDQDLRIVYHIGANTKDIPCYITDRVNPVTCPLDYGDHP